jgi:hypothetical protein
LFLEQDKVNCDFGDTAAGQKSFPVPAAPDITNYFQGLWTSGLFAFPISYYGDNYSSRQIFAGIYQIYIKTGKVELSNVLLDQSILGTELGVKSSKYTNKN